MTHADTPASIDIVLLNVYPNPNRPDFPHYCAGETFCNTSFAEIVNAIYDATRVRVRGNLACLRCIELGGVPYVRAPAIEE